jgi:hypothetical protein
MVLPCTTHTHTHTELSIWSWKIMKVSKFFAAQQNFLEFVSKQRSQGALLVFGARSENFANSRSAFSNLVLVSAHIPTLFVHNNPRKLFGLQRKFGNGELKVRNDVRDERWKKLT